MSQDRGHADAQDPDRRSKLQSWWRGTCQAWNDHPWWRRAVVAVFLGVVAGGLVMLAREVPWGDVWQALNDTPVTYLLLAAGLSALSYATYAAFDLLGKRVTGHGVGNGAVMAVASVCYAVNQNLGYLVGGVALRGRLYGRLGLDMATVGVVVGTSVLTNWAGYLAMLGVVLLVAPLPLPADWPVSLNVLRAVGLAGLLVAAAYLWACARLRRRDWTLVSAEVTLPSLPMAAVQMTMSILNWLLMAAVIWAVLPSGTGYLPVLTTFLLASLAGVVAHIPAGVGVLETVFVTLMGTTGLATAPVLAAVLLYRAVYQWGPGLLALAAYAWLEHLPADARADIRRSDGNAEDASEASMAPDDPVTGQLA